MKNAPVAVFTYNRPEKTKNILLQLNLLPEATDTALFIFSDMCKKEKDKDSVMAVCEILKDFESQSNFAQLHIEYAEENKGLAKSIITGVTKIINEYGAIIVLEDDLQIANDFLKYMNVALSTYQENNEVWAISGYTFPMKAFANYQHEVYTCGRGCSWGWATWKDRWDTVDWDVSDYGAFKFNPFKRYSFTRWGNDLACMLDAYMRGEIHSWAIRWCYAGWKQGKKTIYPVKSRIINDGTDGSGTNYTSSVDTYDTKIEEYDSLPELGFYKENPAIRKEFREKYSHGVQRLKMNILSFLYRTGLQR